MVRSRALALFALSVPLAAGACGQTSTAGRGATASPSRHATIPLPAAGLITPGTLTLGADIPYAPQEFIDGAHNPAGFDIDIGRALANRLGLTLAVVNQDFDHLISELGKRRFDIVLSAMTINETRSAQVAFVPYFRAGAAMVVVSGGPYQPRVLADLCGHRVGVESGTVEMDEVKALTTCGSSPPTVRVFGTDPEGLQELQQGNIDAEFTDSPPAAYAAKQSGGRLVVSSGILDTAPEGIAISKSNTALVAAVAAAFGEIRSDGTYLRLLDKWGLANGNIG